MPRLVCLSLVFAFAAGCSVLPPEIAGAVGSGTVSTATGGLEVGYDRNGNDYRSFAMDGANAASCRDACREDTRCRAFTWTRPGYQDPTGMCWLKDAAPPTSRLAEATSGVVRR